MSISNGSYSSDLSSSCIDITSYRAFNFVWIERTNDPWYPALVLDSGKLEDELNRTKLNVKRMPSKSFLEKKKDEDQLVYEFGR